MKRLSSQNKTTRSSQVISNGIYFGQFQNPQPLLTAVSNTQLKPTQDLRRRNFIPKKRLQSPKILSPRQQNTKPIKSFFQTKPSPKASYKPPTIIVTQPTNRSTVIRIRSPIKRNQQPIISQEMDNKSIELLQELANSQLNRTSRKKRRPQTAGGYTIPSQHFSNNIENYLIQEQIGQGSYGIVKVGLNLLNGQQVAIKIYERIKIISKKEYIRKEIQILSSLQHPNIVQLLDVIYTDTQVQLVMEYVGPLSLRAYLKQQPNKLIPETEAKNIFLQVVKAIDYCHSKNIIHRDIKLENILIKDNKIKLIDFGFSSFIEHKTTSYCGTPSYMAPEIILKIDYGKPADIWSLGILLYVMLHGKFPFQGKEQKELFSKIKTGIFSSNGISQQAQRLINNMLRVRSYERCNTKEIIKDQWFQQ
ncbi:unnamed protein product [Paramecium pentaurelia]|uniref:Protein kinase domain-containing protein n=1 Tax=Paramecium pentaurelia TaxID=43138 RepID=A0A8S1VZZ4_9CILI|nr:unnamed protein product [Paramecium pentaurelia]